MELEFAFESWGPVYRINGPEQGFPRFASNCEIFVGLDDDPPYVDFKAIIRKRDGLWCLDEIGVTGWEFDEDRWPSNELLNDLCDALEKYVDDGPLFFEPWDPVLEEFLRTWRPERYKVYQKVGRNPAAHIRAFKKQFGHCRDEKRSKRKRPPRKSALNTRPTD